MPVTVSTSEGVTVLTLTSDPNSVCPPLCQILKGLCCSPRCCTLSQQLKENQGTSQSILGALHIMVGLLIIGFSVILCAGHGSAWEIRETYFPFWFGGLFICLGAMCILSERHPSPGLVVLNMTLNTVGFAFAMASIVLYSKNIANIWWQEGCFDYSDKTPWETLFQEKCLEKAALITKGTKDFLYRSLWRLSWISLLEKTCILYVVERVVQASHLLASGALMPRQLHRFVHRVQVGTLKQANDCIVHPHQGLVLLKGINSLLIILSVMEVCVAISSVVLGFKTLGDNSGREEQSCEDPEQHTPLLADGTDDPSP